jgi:hypothetical protein
MKKIAVLFLMMSMLVLVNLVTPHTKASVVTQGCGPNNPPEYDESCEWGYTFLGCTVIDGVEYEIWFSPSCGTINRPIN